MFVYQKKIFQRANRYLSANIHNAP